LFSIPARKLSLSSLGLLQQYLPLATDAAQHDWRKKKDRLGAVSPKSDLVFCSGGTDGLVVMDNQTRHRAY
jgi:hypothetical protein